MSQYTNNKDPFKSKIKDINVKKIKEDKSKFKKEDKSVFLEKIYRDGKYSSSSKYSKEEIIRQFRNPHKQKILDLNKNEEYLKSSVFNNRMIGGNGTTKTTIIYTKIK